MKKLLLIILFFAIVKFANADFKLPINIKLDTEAKRYKFFKINILSTTDSIVKINSIYDSIILYEFTDSLNFSHQNIFEIYYSEDAEVWKKFKQSFTLTGKEKNLEIKITFYPSSEVLYQVNIFRNYNAENIKLISAWNEKIGSEPVYKLINNSNLTFYSLYNEFWGDVYIFDDNKWKFDSFGGICGTRGSGPAFRPGDTIISKCPDFMFGDYYTQEFGLYKYIVEMSSDLENWGFTRSIPDEELPYRNINDIYLIVYLVVKNSNKLLFRGATTST
ncbi:MAG: hypothetical protein J0M18_17640 [Ignavibacteria bacterium]|nr:hypothetical protein [Ignavibacteria bacterium]